MLKKVFILLCLSLFLKVAEGQERVRISTTKGNIIVSLYKNTPIHRKNFLRLVKEGFYDSTAFHRVITEFMIQGGDPNSKPSSGSNKYGAGGPGYTLEAELDKGHIHKRGALAAAREPDEVNPSKRSNGSQFYIVVGRKYPRRYLGKFEEENGISYSETDKLNYENDGGTPHLDGNYTVFGQVLEGMDVVDEISKVETGRADRPKESVYIIKMDVLQ